MTTQTVESRFSRETVTKLLVDLVAIPSVNPRDGNGDNEQQLAEFVNAWFEEAGIRSSLHEVTPGRSNVRAQITGKDRSRTLLLEAHLDTVEIDNMTVEPFHAGISDGRLYGRGTADCKGSMTAYMLAMKAINDAGIEPNVNIEFLGAVDEEHRGAGIFAYLDDLDESEKIIGSIVGEPTDLRCVVAHKGSLRFAVETSGISAHSSLVDKGDNAIYYMADVLSMIRDEFVPELKSIIHPLLGNPTFSANLISGGAGQNIIPEKCTLTVERRCVPGEDVKTIWTDYKRRLESLAPDNIRVTEPLRWVIPPESDPSHEVASALRSTLNKKGLDPAPAGISCGTDASKIFPRGIPFVVFGPGSIEDAHQPDESVKIQDVVQATDVVFDCIKSLD